MSKFEPLWSYIQKQDQDLLKLTYQQIEEICCPLDHSFLTYKKELIPFGFQVKKISMKEQTVLFERINGE